MWEASKVWDPDLLLRVAVEASCPLQPIPMRDLLPPTVTATATETAAPPPVVMVIRGANSHRFESAGELAPSALPALPSSLRISLPAQRREYSSLGAQELEPEVEEDAEV